MAAVQPVAMRNHTILLADDDDDIRESVSELLEDEGYRVVLARDGAEALRVLKDGLRPSLFLLDLMMPGVDGWAVLEELRGDVELSALPIVVFTAAQPNGRDELLRRPTLRKPIDPDLLLAMVQEAARVTFMDEPPSDLLPKVL